MIFTSDVSANQWQKSLLTVTNILFYFLRAILCPEQLSIAGFAIAAKDGLFSLALWCHHNWSVTSLERWVLALWRHIRRLFLHAQIGAKISTSE